MAGTARTLAMAAVMALLVALALGAPSREAVGYMRAPAAAVSEGANDVAAMDTKIDNVDTVGQDLTVPSSDTDTDAEEPAPEESNSNEDTAPAEDNANDATPEESNATPEETAPEEATPEESNSNEDNSADSSSDACKDACIPSIDSKASVMESYKRHRAQAALIGDYGSCKPASKNTYTWEIEWGDDEEHVKKLHHVGPFHAEHTYSKKGKYQLDAKFCAHLDGCDSGCTTISKKLKVKP